MAGRLWYARGLSFPLAWKGLRWARRAWCGLRSEERPTEYGGTRRQRPSLFAPFPDQALSMRLSWRQRWQRSTSSWSNAKLSAKFFIHNLTTALTAIQNTPWCVARSGFNQSIHSSKKQGSTQKFAEVLENELSVAQTGDFALEKQEHHVPHCFGNLWEEDHNDI